MSYLPREREPYLLLSCPRFIRTVGERKCITSHSRLVSSSHLQEHSHLTSSSCPLPFHLIFRQIRQCHLLPSCLSFFVKELLLFLPHFLFPQFVTLLTQTRIASQDFLFVLFFEGIDGMALFYLWPSTMRSET